eukprot:877679-Rhodomonas_salina.2
MDTGSERTERAHGLKSGVRAGGADDDDDDEEDESKEPMTPAQIIGKVTHSRACDDDDECGRGTGCWAVLSGAPSYNLLSTSRVWGLSML